MIQFLSEENINLHKEYYRNLKHKYSILEKSIGALKGKSLDGLYGLRIAKDAKQEAINLAGEIYLHELFFSSFIPDKEIKRQNTDKIKAEFGSWENFVFEGYMYAKQQKNGFLILSEKGNRLCFLGSEGMYKLPKIFLALDLSEHAYFLDYKFERDDYIKSALFYWNTEKIN
jgi:superoxide dismutase